MPVAMSVMYKFYTAYRRITDIDSTKNKIMNTWRTETLYKTDGSVPPALFLYTVSIWPNDPKQCIKHAGKVLCQHKKKKELRGDHFKAQRLSAPHGPQKGTWDVCSIH